MEVAPPVFSLAGHTVHKRVRGVRGGLAPERLPRLRTFLPGGSHLPRLQRRQGQGLKPGLLQTFALGGLHRCLHRPEASFRHFQRGPHLSAGGPLEHQQPVPPNEIDQYLVRAVCPRGSSCHGRSGDVRGTVLHGGDPVARQNMTAGESSRPAAGHATGPVRCLLDRH